MRPKHNKKRNTAFVYESLVKEATVAILKNDYERRDKVVNIIKKHFNRTINLANGTLNGATVNKATF